MATAHDRGRVNQEWLDKVQEAAIDPSRPLIDPHHHVWANKRGYPYMIEDLAGDFGSGHNVIASVFVTSNSEYLTEGPEHLKPVGETEWIHRRAEAYAAANPSGGAICAGIVGFADLLLDTAKLDEVLEAHKAASGRFRGLRHTAPWTDDPVVGAGRLTFVRHQFLDPTLHRGVARLAPQGLTLDAYVFHDQIGDIAALARAVPDVPIVCVHLGGPLGQGGWANRRDEALQQWRKGVVELARLPNVYMKLCGPAMPWFGFGWEARPLPPTSDELVAAVDHFHQFAIDTLSPARCMFESNFPVDKQAVGYVPLWNSFKKVAGRYSPSEQADLLCNTAKRFYKLDSVKVPASEEGREMQMQEMSPG